jgi:hypothetical protein
MSSQIERIRPYRWDRTLRVACLDSSPLPRIFVKWLFIVDPAVQRIPQIALSLNYEAPALVP